MSRPLLLGLLGALSLFFASTSRASDVEGPRISFSPHAGAAVWLDDIDLATDVLLGGRMGLALSPWFGIEGTLDVNPTHREGDDETFDRVTHASLGAILRLLPRRGVSPYLTGGWSNLHFDPSGGSEENVQGFEAGAGLEIRLAGAPGRRVDLRLDARNVFLRPDTGSSFGDANQNAMLFTAGLQFTMGGARGDRDHDGISDADDRCPDTPAGVLTDAMGCPLDGDLDGVFDGIDLCPDTVRGAVVDARGCAMDDDRDGVPDGIDSCPDTPWGAIVDAAGCPRDGDRDGVPDGIDRCADTPSGVIVDPATGCALDTDGDGVADGLDRCANTPRGTAVDAQGCAIVVSAREAELLDTGMIRLNTVQFESGRAVLRPESAPSLREVGEILMKWPQLRIEIGGHTDNVGDERQNLLLSEDRALAVYNWLRENFPVVPEGQLVVKGYGESRSIATNDTREGRAENRRVEFRVLNMGVLEKKD